MTALPAPLSIAAVSSPARAIRIGMMLAIVQGLWMATAVNFVAPRFVDLLTGDIAYFLGAARHVMAGEMPYRDFSFEYPPGALLPVVLPAVLAHSTETTAYLWAFVAQSALLAGVITLLLARSTGLKSAVVFNSLLAIGAAFVPLRFDLLPALLTLLAVMWAIDRPGRSGAILALGVCVKLYPLVLLPFLVLPHLAERNWKALFQSLSAFAGTMLAILLPTYLLSRGHVFDFFAFHGARGLQIESVGGAFVLLASKLHWAGASVGTNFFSSNVTSPWSKVATAVMRVLMLAALVVHFVVCWARYRKNTFATHELAIMVTTVLWIFIAGNKVFSPQYMVWVLPLVAMTLDRVRVVATATLLSAIVFPFLYDALKQIEWLPVALVCARNGIVIVLITYGLTTRPRNRIAPV